jgi:hypothetical protein
MIYRKFAYRPNEKTYHVFLYRHEVKVKHRACMEEDKVFFYNPYNILPFTEAQKTELKRILLFKRYSVVQERDTMIFFEYKNDGVVAVLTDSVLYFVATWDDDNIFEIRMTASEFTDTEEFAKYDPQHRGWEEIEY